MYSTHELIISGRVILFASEGGGSFNGDRVLCSDEVPQQWAKVSKSISEFSKRHKLDNSCHSRPLAQAIAQCKWYV